MLDQPAWKSVATVLAACLFALTLAACDDEGPAERAGKQIDNTVECAGEAVEDAGDRVRDNTD